MPEPTSPKPKKLLDQLRDAIRIKHYSYSSEKKVRLLGKVRSGLGHLALKQMRH